MRRVVLVALLLVLAGCQLGTIHEPATRTSTTSARDAARAKLGRLSTSTTSAGLPLTNDVVTSRPSKTITLSEGDGICSHAELGSNGKDCR